MDGGAPLIPPFMLTQSPVGLVWCEYATTGSLTLDAYGRLAGPWAECLCWAVHYEHSVSWQGQPEYASGVGPAGGVIAALSAAAAGYGNGDQLRAAADALEREAHSMASSGQPIPVINAVASPGSMGSAPSAWNQGPPTPVAYPTTPQYGDPYAGLYGGYNPGFLGAWAGYDLQTLQHQQELWQQKEANPEFFGQVVLARDGGMSEVDELYSETRTIFAFINIGFILLNVGTMLYRNISLLRGRWVIPEEENKQFMLSNFLLDSVGHIPFISERMRGNDIIAINLVAMYELAVLTFKYFFRILLLLCLTLSSRATGGNRFWRSCANFFWTILPGLSSFSAMRMLGSVAPSVFMRHLMERIGTLRQACADSGEQGCCPVVKAVFFLILFFPISGLSFVVGFDAFLVKLRDVSAVAAYASPKRFSEMILVCQFLQQALGIIDINQYTQHRLQVFIFGGEDGVMSLEDTDLLNTWKAMLAREIWKCYGLRRFLIIMLTWSDYDFQKLVLNNEDPKKNDDAINLELSALRSGRSIRSAV